MFSQVSTGKERQYIAVSNMTHTTSYIMIMHTCRGSEPTPIEEPFDPSCIIVI
jgi:hypothetical protein